MLEKVDICRWTVPGVTAPFDMNCKNFSILLQKLTNFLEQFFKLEYGEELDVLC